MKAVIDGVLYRPVEEPPSQALSAWPWPVGTVVKVCTTPLKPDLPQLGAKGVVIAVDRKKDDVAVVFTEAFGMGHTCSRVAPSGHGRWVHGPGRETLSEGAEALVDFELVALPPVQQRKDF